MTLTLRHTVREAQQGSLAAAAELLTQFEPLIRKQARRYRRHYQSAEEACSTGQSAVLECMYSLDLTKPGSVARHMNTAVHRSFSREAYRQSQCREELRPIEQEDSEGRTIWAVSLDDSDAVQPEQSAIQNEQFAALRAARSRLSPQEQCILYLRFEQNKTYKEIGQLMHMTPGGVWHLLERVYRHLRQELTVFSP